MATALKEAQQTSTMSTMVEFGEEEDTGEHHDVITATADKQDMKQLSHKERGSQQ